MENHTLNKNIFEFIIERFIILLLIYIHLKEVTSTI